MAGRKANRRYVAPMQKNGMLSELLAEAVCLDFVSSCTIMHSQ